jgi:hypothetical protein
MLQHPWPPQQHVSILFRWQLFTPQGQGARPNHTYHLALHHQQPTRSPLPERALPANMLQRGGNDCIRSTHPDPCRRG